MIKAVLSTEKALRLIETENTLTIIVPKEVNKTQIKQYFEKLGYKVKKVNTLNIRGGEKKAYVKFEKEGAARELASKFGALT